MWALYLACTSKPEPVAEPAIQGSNLVVVTLDTTRADALGAYGGPASPIFDELAARGTRFAWAISHTSTTLNAHTSLFTGYDPHGHAVPRNGFTLPDELETVASRMRSAGWDTIGIAAASALDSETKIDRGFRIWNDDLTIDKGVRYEARGDDVTRRALEAVDQRQTDRPLLLFVHYYDAHSPYEAPDGPSTSWDGVEDALEQAAKASRDGTLTDGLASDLRAMYQAEVLYQDGQLGELFAGLTERGVLDDESHIVITADHGEMFFENRTRPVGHGPDVDLPVTHIPLLVVGPKAQPLVVEQPVKLSDVGPTLLDLVDLEATLGTGQSLTPLLAGGSLPTTPIYLEATRPYRQEGPKWNNLPAERGVVDDGHLLIKSGKKSGSSRLYALDAEQTPAADPDRKTAMTNQLHAWDEAAPEYRPETMSDSMREALRALGYMDE